MRVPSVLRGLLLSTFHVFSEGVGRLAWRALFIQALPHFCTKLESHGAY